MNDGDRFELRGSLGNGGHGEVYLVHDRQHGVEVAMKVLRSTSGRDLYRFKREFRALADLDHPGLVALYELFAVGPQWMFTMELVRGVPFGAWVRPDGALDEARLRAALIQLADALTALHAAGMIHRDLKPSNVLVERGGRVVLLDFGLVTAAEAGARDLTHDYAAVGTPAYMSPEQAADRAITTRSDWYAVGAMLFEALTGQRPFVGTSTEVMAAKLQRDPPPPGALAAVPRDLEDLCLALLARDPDARPDGPRVLAALGAAPSEATHRLLAGSPPPRVVGRERELAALHRALDDSRDHCVYVNLLGPPGSGKTALLDQFFREVRGRALVLATRADRREAVPMRAFDRLTDALVNYLLTLPRDERAALIPPAFAVVGRAFPAVRRLPEAEVPILPGMLPADPDALYRRAFELAIELVRALARRHPLVLAVEDAQFGTVEGARLVNPALERPDAPRALCIITHVTGGEPTESLRQMQQFRGDRRVIELA